MKNKFLVAFPIAFMMMIMLACTSNSTNANTSSGNDQTNTEIISEVTTEETKDIVSLVEEALVGRVGSDDAITDVVFENNQLTISVKLADYDDPEALVVSRTSSITDAILELEEINEVETIKVEFEGIGSVTKKLSDAIDSEYGRYFDIKDSDLK